MQHTLQCWWDTGIVVLTNSAVTGSVRFLMALCSGSATSGSYFRFQFGVSMAWSLPHHNRRQSR